MINQKRILFKNKKKKSKFLSINVGPSPLNTVISYSLSFQKVEEQERADRAKASENELKARVAELKKMYEYEKDKLFCIV
jgi:hypothetical protein